MTTHQAEVKRPRFGPFSWAICLLALFYLLSKWNPLDYVMEAGSSAYYQARIGYERGASSEREQIAIALKDGKISMHEYSKTIFPAFLKVAGNTRDGLEVFPDAERAKSIEDQRHELLQALAAK